MFGKMMNRFYYGKSGKGDYTKEDLPTTRWQLFWEMLRVRFASLFKLNLLYMIAWIPAIIVIGRGVMLAYSGLANVVEHQAMMIAGEITEDAFRQINGEFMEAVKALLMQTLVLLVPALAVTGPFTAGISYVTRNWARDEHAFVLSDFMDAVKENWKHALITSTITGLAPLLMYVCITFYGQMAAQSVLYAIPQALIIMVGVVWMSALMYIYPQMVTYKINYKGLLRNSIIMVIGRLPMTIGIKLITLIPLMICLAVSFLTPYAQYALMIYAAYYILVGFALSRFIQASYANAVFDRYLNVNIEGAQVGRGLYNEEDEEEEAASEEENQSADL
ncbi:MAG: YesL family protein [Clostridia bacterium]|nr:YesL family protein [Clostridia bacterium]